MPESASVGLDVRTTPAIRDRPQPCTEDAAEAAVPGDLDPLGCGGPCPRLAGVALLSFRDVVMVPQGREGTNHGSREGAEQCGPDYQCERQRRHDNGDAVSQSGCQGSRRPQQ